MDIILRYHCYNHKEIPVLHCTKMIVFEKKILGLVFLANSGDEKEYDVIKVVESGMVVQW